jgi:hypothetical protein
MSREYYNLRFRLDACEAYLIWFSDERDGVVLQADGKVPCFSCVDDLMQYAVLRNFSVDSEDANLHDLDAIARWLAGSATETVECVNFLNIWNLFDDFSRSVAGNFDAERKLTNKIYDKLFWGNNLPAVTPVGKHYDPIWTKRELKIMREVLGVGLTLFRERLVLI